MTTTTTAVQEFVDAVNSQDLVSLTRLMSDDHVFIDAGGQRQAGRTLMAERWAEFFRLVPSYRIELETVVGEGATLAAFGRVSFQVASQVERVFTPAAWRVTTQSGQITQWQVFCDIEPLLRAHGFDRWTLASR